MSRAKYSLDETQMQYIWKYQTDDEILPFMFVGTFTECKKRYISKLELELEQAKLLTEKDIKK